MSIWLSKMLLVFPSRFVFSRLFLSASAFHNFLPSRHVLLHGSRATEAGGRHRAHLLLRLSLWSICSMCAAAHLCQRHLMISRTTLCFFMAESFFFRRLSRLQQERWYTMAQSAAL